LHLASRDIYYNISLRHSITDNGSNFKEKKSEVIFIYLNMNLG
jgi:hypothetical protein